MPEKIIIIFLSLLLSSCTNIRTAACSRYFADDQITIEIEAENDIIRKAEVSEVFVLPYESIADEKTMDFIRKQLDSSYHFEENRLIRRYALSLDQEYSLAKTLEYLKNEKYYCE